ncbi:uncharacterized protein LOC144194461 isoform X2 [Stigmatopora nigra]
MDVAKGKLSFFAFLLESLHQPKVKIHDDTPKWNHSPVFRLLQELSTEEKKGRNEDHEKKISWSCCDGTAHGDGRDETGGTVPVVSAGSLWRSLTVIDAKLLILGGWCPERRMTNASASSY